MRLVGAHILTARQAQDLYFAEIRRLYATAVSDDGTENMAIKCYGCGKVVVVGRHVQRYRCQCSPNVERFTIKSRDLGLQIGKPAVETLIASAHS